MSEKQPSLSLPSRTISINIGDRQYSVKFPNNGQFIDIERAKLDLSSGNLKNMLFGTTTGQLAYMLIEAIATFNVLIPDLAKDLEVKSLLDLDPYQSRELIVAYEKQYFPWIEQWRKIINAPIQDEEDKKDSDEK